MSTMTARAAIELHRKFRDLLRASADHTGLLAKLHNATAGRPDDWAEVHALAAELQVTLSRASKIVGDIIALGEET